MWIIPIFLGLGFYYYVKKLFVKHNLVETKCVRKRRHRRNKFKNLPAINENNCKITDSDDETETISENKSKTWCHDYKDMNIRNNVPLVQLAYLDLEYNLSNKENKENKENISFEKEISNSPINKIMDNEVKNDNISDTSSNTSSTHLSSDYTSINYDDITDII